MKELDKPENIIRFEQMCEAHDLTFEYSDDGRCYNKGRKSLSDIRYFAASYLTRETTCFIWNRMVTKKVNPDYVKDFLWEP